MDQTTRVRACTLWGTPFLVGMASIGEWALCMAGVASGGLPWLTAALLALWWSASVLCMPPAKACWNGGSARKWSLAWRRACAPAWAATVAMLAAAAAVFCFSQFEPMGIFAAGAISMLLGHGTGYAVYRYARMLPRKRFGFHAPQR